MVESVLLQAEREFAEILEAIQGTTPHITLNVERGGARKTE